MKKIFAMVAIFVALTVSPFVNSQAQAEDIPNDAWVYVVYKDTFEQTSQCVAWYFTTPVNSREFFSIDIRQSVLVAGGWFVSFDTDDICRKPVYGDSDACHVEVKFGALETKSKTLRGYQGSSPNYFRHFHYTMSATEFREMLTSGMLFVRTPNGLVKIDMSKFDFENGCKNPNRVVEQ